MPVTDNSQVIPAAKIPSEDEIVSSLPKMITPVGLCKIMHISNQTFRNWQVSKPFLIPRAINVGTEKKQMLRFYISDVREKLMEIREKYKHDPRTPALSRVLEAEILPMPPGVEIVE